MLRAWILPPFGSHAPFLFTAVLAEFRGVVALSKLRVFTVTAIIFSPLESQV
jgi:hypothetical protein